LPDVDVFVGSDLVFPSNSEVHGMLARLIGRLVKSGARGWLAQERREQRTDDAFWATLAACGVAVEQLPADRHPAGAGSDLMVVQLRAQ
jgi:hypothetical protein